jgi:hypothetical protein
MITLGVWHFSSIPLLKFCDAGKRVVYVPAQVLGMRMIKLPARTMAGSVV